MSRAAPRLRVTLEWHEQAKCAGLDVTIFYPEVIGGRHAEKRALEAKAICSGCPVQAECLAYGMSDRFGVFGGLTPEERREVRLGLVALG